MRDVNRIDVYCEQLKELWKKNPDLRFGQMILNVIYPDYQAAYFREDNEMFKLLNEFYRMDNSDS